MDLAPTLIVVLFFLLLQAFFSGAEIALIACDKKCLKDRAARGARGAALAQKMLDHPEWLLGTTLVGTNLAAVINTVLVTLLMVADFPREGALVAGLIMAPVILFWGEILPRRFFEQKADALAPRVVHVLWFASRLFSPLLWLITVFPRAVFGRGGSGAGPGHGILERDDLQLLLHAPQDGSDILAEERKMVDRLIDLSEQKVSEVMIPLVDVVAVPETADREQIVKLMLDKGHSRLPVFRDRIVYIVGVLHHFDLLLASDQRNGIADIMRPPFFVPETKPVYELFLFMKKSGNTMAVAVDEYGGATGIITVEDILEEIVGEIEDEYDSRKLLYRKIGPSSYLVEARVEVDELVEKLSLDIPEGDYETLGGFLMSKMGKIPEEGEALRLPGWVITGDKATPRSVERVRLDRQ